MKRFVRQQLAALAVQGGAGEDCNGGGTVVVVVGRLEREEAGVRVAARDLQKRVLLGLFWHWEQVPGPEGQPLFEGPARV